jgi:hypothetical protein
MLTFDIKIGNKILKMKMFDDEDPRVVVQKFCFSFGISKEREYQLLDEIS